MLCESVPDVSKPSCSSLECWAGGLPQLYLRYRLTVRRHMQLLPAAAGGTAASRPSSRPTGSEPRALSVLRSRREGHSANGKAPKPTLLYSRALTLTPHTLTPGCESRGNLRVTVWVPDSQTLLHCTTPMRGKLDTF